jgi:Ca2+-transporting ATPase
VYEDPIRPGVKEALRQAQKAGIEVKVITGDYLSTAQAVLRKLGIETKDCSIEGQVLSKEKGQAYQDLVKKTVLFARTSPEEKLTIVQALQSKGGVVAMTGDGVNDAPALKAADIGIVVNDASDVSKQTADIVLLDSNFATIVAAVKEGRVIFENIKKVVLYLLSHSFTEVILIGGTIVLGLPLPVTAVQILWVNLVEDSLPAIALAYEPEEGRVMEQPPRSKNAPILDGELRFLIFFIGLSLDITLLGLFYYLNQGLFHLQYIQTVMFAALAIDSPFICLASRSLKKSALKINFFANRFLLFSLLVSFLLLFAAIYWPPLQVLLDTHPLGIYEWIFLFGLGLLNFAAIEIAKWFFLIRHRQ